MPLFDLFKQFNHHLTVAEQWQVNGSHYEKTARCWRENLHEQRKNLDVLFPDLTAAERKRQFHRWRLFFLACEETFGANKGEDWFVGHYRLRRSAS